MSNGLLQFDNKVKEANLIFINKTEFYNQSLNVYKNKIKDYKNKISILKKKINELYLVIEKIKLNGNYDFNKDINNISNINNRFNRHLVSTPGPYRHARGAKTPFSKSYFRDKDELSLYNYNKKNNISIFDEKAFNSANNINITSFQDNYKEKKINMDNGLSNFEDNDNKLDYDQRKYLENYKSFLSGLDYQVNPKDI